MKIDEIRDIIDCLPKGRTKFYYFKDRYALLLLSHFVREGMTIREIKKSRFSRLIQKPEVQKIIKNAGNGRLTADALRTAWPQTYHCYLLTLGVWGDRKEGARFYNQTSRPGWNLVLQMNFSEQHNRPYYRTLEPRDSQPFHCESHPIAKDGHHTLAWARIDIDFRTGEALIEEIQSDWIRLAIWSKTYLAALENDSVRNPQYIPGYVKNIGCDLKTLSNYLNNTLRPHIQLWDEAMLASAIWFLQKEIGINKIYYHTFKFGCRIKRITNPKPPRSLYTKLPDRFCFKRTKQAPSFLMRRNNRKIIDLIKNHEPAFYLLDINSRSF